MKSRSVVGALVGAALVLVLAAAALLRPAAWRVERSAVVASTPAQVRDLLVEPQRWLAWWPAAPRGEAVEITSGGPPRGPGAAAYWRGPGAGESGRLTVDAATLTHVELEVQLQGPTWTGRDFTIELEPEAGGTRVRWTVSGEAGPWRRLLALAWSFEAEHGPALDLALGALREAAEATARVPTFRVERSAVVAAAPAQVLAVLADAARWPAWWPGLSSDGEASWSFGGPAAGAGASAYWRGEGAVGRGRVTLTRLADGQAELEEEAQGPRVVAVDHALRVVPEGSGARVTWTATGERDPASPSYARPGPADAALGEVLEAGLRRLTRLIEVAHVARQAP